MDTSNYPPQFDHAKRQEVDDWGLQHPAQLSKGDEDDFQILFSSHNVENISSTIVIAYINPQGGRYRQATQTGAQHVTVEQLSPVVMHNARIGNIEHGG